MKSNDYFKKMSSDNLKALLNNVLNWIQNHELDKLKEIADRLLNQYGITQICNYEFI